MNAKKAILESIETKLRIASDNEFLRELERIGIRMVTALKMGRKILIAGNGGSAADAQHFAAELAGQFVHERKGLPVMALTTNASITTAIGNDFGYDHVFSRQVDGFGNKGDVFVSISTSGNSANLIHAASIAKNIGLITVGLLGKNGGQLKNYCDHNLIVPSNSTQRIQEAHILIIHELCAIIDDAFKNY